MLFSNQILSQWGGMGPGMMGGYGGGYGMGFFGILIMAAFWIAVIAGIIFLVRWLAVSSRTGAQEPKAGDSAREILKRRYARGEINREEFEEKKKDLL